MQSRILLALILASADDIKAGTAAVLGAAEEISLICSSSNRRLTDPILLNSSIVQRNIALLRQRGGPLYRPAMDVDESEIAELDDHGLVHQILSHSKMLPDSSSILALHVERIGLVPPSSAFTLDSLGRDFIYAIQCANKTDLVTRGPLELKSPNVVPPQIVVDEDVRLLTV